MTDEFRAEDIGGDRAPTAPERIRNLDDLTDLETWSLWKYRSGLSNKQAAIKLEVKPDLVRSWAEADKHKVLPMAQVREDLAKLGPITDGERCRMYRQRTGLMMKDVAGRMGVSRIWIWNMETDRASCKRLLEMYENWVA